MRFYVPYIIVPKGFFNTTCFTLTLAKKNELRHGLGATYINPSSQSTFDGFLGSNVSCNCQKPTFENKVSLTLLQSTNKSKI